MKKITKSLMTLALLAMGVTTVSAQENLVDEIVNGDLEGTELSNFRVNDYVDGEKRPVAEPRVVVDPDSPTNHCIVVTTNENPADEGTPSSLLHFLNVICVRVTNYNLK